MGVGNYRDGFGDAGESFYVDAPDLSDEAYASYAADGDDPMDVDTWREITSQDAWSELKGSIAASLSHLGFEAPGRNRNDGDVWEGFTLVASDDTIAVGLLDWEGYRVVGVAPVSNTLAAAKEPDAHVGEIMDRFALPPTEFAETASALASKVAARVRIALIEDGYALRSRTGPWTSVAIAAPEAVAAVLDREIVALQGILSESWTVSKLIDPGPRRDAFVEAIHRASLEHESTDARLVAFAFVEGKAQAFDPSTGRIERGLSFDSPDFLRGSAENDPESVYVVSSEDGDAAVDFLRDAAAGILVRHRGAFPVFLDEFERITGDEPEVEDVEDLIAETAPAPAP